MICIQTLATSQKTNNTSFRGIPVARVIPHTGGKEIILYELTKKDIQFAKKMSEKLDLKALHPNLENYDGFVSWKTIIKRAVDRIGHQPVFLAVQNKRPCGIIAYRNSAPKTSVISALATWPPKVEEPAEHAGKALIRKAFQYTHEKQNTCIELRPAQAKPRGKSCKDFYAKLGFQKAEEDNDLQELWEIKDAMFNKKCAQLENYFHYKEIKNGKEENLERTLTLKPTDTLMEKLTKIFRK